MFLDQVFLPLFSNTTVTHYVRILPAGCVPNLRAYRALFHNVTENDLAFYKPSVHSLLMREILGLFERRPLCGVYETRTRQAVNGCMEFTPASR